jgi:pSer/pThr/pTyr-binding forkhead associated (FHA) protein
MYLMDGDEVRDELAELGRDGFAKRFGRYFLVLTSAEQQDQFASFVNTATRDANEISSGKRLQGVDVRPIQNARGGAVTVGREGADIVIRHPKVSKHHATFSLSGGLLSLADAGSKNGTWLNGSALDSKGRPVDVGDTVNFGSVNATVWGLDDLLAACEKR